MKVLAIVLISFFAMSRSFAGSKTQVIALKVTEKGFEPSTLNVIPGTSVTLDVTRTTDETCAKSIQIQSKKIKRELPLNKVVSIDLGKLEKGEIRFACGMDMLTGKIVVQ